MNILLKNHSEYQNLFALEDMRQLLRSIPSIADAYSEENLPASVAPDFEIILLTDHGMKGGSWHVSPRDKGVDIIAPHADGLACGIYDMLESCGLRFEVTGPVIPEDSGIDKFVRDAADHTTVPDLRYRGIRQHINFPMDISSYSLCEAKKYVRNLVRMKFNSIVFHSYGWQWCCSEELDQTAGHYFYGCPHTIPNNAFVKEKLRNEQIYCMPEAEPYFNNPEKNSQIAIFWLRELIKESVRVGLKVSFSYQAADYKTEDISMGVAKKIISDYPGISTLELVTMEMVGSDGFDKNGNTDDTVREKIVGMFGADAFSEEVESALKACENKDKVLGALNYVEFNLSMMDKLSLEYPSLPLRLGIYVPDTPVLSVIYPLLAANVPEKYTIAYLPNYGSKNTYEVTDIMTNGKPDVKRTVYYSWAEMDGDMYLMQNHCQGLHDLTGLMKRNADEQGRANEICVNHWRNAENSESIRYFAENAIDTSETPDDFYRNTANYYKIADPELYVQAQTELNRASEQSDTTAFCYVGCWFTEKEESSRPGVVNNTQALKGARARYEKSLDSFRRLSAESGECAQSKLRLTINRIEATLLHYDCWLELSPINDITAPYKLLSEMPAESVSAVADCADRAMVHAKKYLLKYAEIMPDRGSEGLISSYYKTMVYYIDHIKRKYRGIPLPELYETVPLDPPPAPGER